MPAAKHCFGTIAPSPGVRRPLPPAMWTGIGALSIPMWATWPTLAVWASEMPVFQILAIAFTFGWAVLTTFERTPRIGASAREGKFSSAMPVIACALGLMGANAFFIIATASIPAAQANLISYLWPIMVVGFGAILGFFRLRLRHVAGLTLGFGGAAVVISVEEVVFSWGIGFAALSGVSWALFCLFRLREGAKAGNVLAAGCGISAIFCTGLHVMFEVTVLPSVLALISAICIGIIPLGLANLAWDNGLRRGDSQLLATMAYATPLAGALVLIAAGIALPSFNLFLGALMIVGAGLLSKAERGLRAD